MDVPPLRTPDYFLAARVCLLYVWLEQKVFTAHEQNLPRPIENAKLTKNVHRFIFGWKLTRSSPCVARTCSSIYHFYTNLCRLQRKSLVSEYEHCAAKRVHDSQECLHKANTH